MKKTNYLILIFAGLVFPFTGCRKDFLDAKPNKDIVVPTTVKDIQAMLDHYDNLNKNPGAAFIGSDDYFTIESEWNNYNPWQQQLYIWSEEPFMPDDFMFDWNAAYKAISYANTAFEQIKLFPEKDSAEARKLRGTALFFRAYNYFNLAQLFLPTFGERKNDDKGYIPLRLSPDINKKVPFATVDEIYKLIQEDLTQALLLLPETTTLRTRPNKYSAHALLARIYMAAEEYELAKQHAQIVYLSGYKLLDYNTLDLSKPYPVPPLSEEVIIHADLSHDWFNGSYFSLVDSNLYKSYDEYDLRKEVFFETRPSGETYFQGSYKGDFRYFGGIALDEIYLILAETNARLGQISEGINILNKLLEKRWVNGQFTPFTANSETEALTLILEHRRKELAFRGTRWSDLRRLNKDPRFAVTQTRVMQGITYTLEPNSPRYVLPTPPRELELE